MKATASSTGWTHEQCNQIRNAFGPRKRNNQRFEIIRFIERAATHTPYFEAFSPGLSNKSVQKQLNDTAEAAAALARSLGRLSRQAQGHLSDAGIASNSKGLDTSDAGAASRSELGPWIKNEEMLSSVQGDFWMLQPLEIMARTVTTFVQATAQGIDVSTGARVKESQAVVLAQYLHLQWLIVFKRKGSLVAGQEFHRVSAQVAALYGLKIGSKTLKKADPDRLQLFRQEATSEKARRFLRPQA